MGPQTGIAPKVRLAALVCFSSSRPGVSAPGLFERGLARVVPPLTRLPRLTKNTRGVSTEGVIPGCGPMDQSPRCICRRNGHLFLRRATPLLSPKEVCAAHQRCRVYFSYCTRRSRRNVLAARRLRRNKGVARRQAEPTTRTRFIWRTRRFPPEKKALVSMPMRQFLDIPSLCYNEGFREVLKWHCLKTKYCVIVGI